jgi:cardiolipin synthase
MAKKNNRNIIFYILIALLLSIGLILYGYIFANLNKNSKQKDTGMLNNAMLFIEPQDSRKPIIDAIDHAKRSIDLEVYMLSDDNVISKLIDAKKRGVLVRVILEESPYKGYGANKEVKDRLSHYGIDTKWSNRVYQFTHSKFMVIDKATGYIMTLNLSKSSFTKNREFGAITDESETVEQLLNVFNADWGRKPYFNAASSLVVSPENSRTKIMNLLESAQKEIDIYAEEIEDQQFINVLVEKAKVAKVYVVAADPSLITVNEASLNKLEKSGVETKTMTSPFIHAKAIIIDGLYAYIGSINFSSTSFDKNREVGVLISSQDAVRELHNTFISDFNKKS